MARPHSKVGPWLSSQAGFSPCTNFSVNGLPAQVPLGPDEIRNLLPAQGRESETFVFADALLRLGSILSDFFFEQAKGGVATSSEDGRRRSRVSYVRTRRGGASADPLGQAAYTPAPCSCQEAFLQLSASITSEIASCAFSREQGVSAPLKPS